MSRRSILTLLVTGAAMPAQAQAPESAGALSAVKAFYDPKVKDDQRPLSARLQRLYKAAVARSIKDDGPVNGLDFAPEIDGQDADDNYRQTLKYNVRSADGKRAVVEVSLRQFKDARPITLTYTVVNEGGWKVDDIAKIGQKGAWRWSSNLILGAKGQY